MYREVQRGTKRYRKTETPTRPTLFEHDGPPRLAQLRVQQLLNTRVGEEPEGEERSHRLATRAEKLEARVVERLPQCAWGGGEGEGM